MTFTIYPAIDLRHGQVVRLQHGDPDRQTTFDHNPTAVAQRWLAAGAVWLHVVNLDGAFDEAGAANWDALPALTSLGANVQFGGGMRALVDVERALSIGVSRVVLGTAAIENPALVGEAVQRFGAQRVAVGIDARDGRVKTRGWQTDTAVSPTELARQMKDRGVTTIIYTDISRDGVLTGVNAEATAALARNAGLHVIASGGVASLDDVRRLLPHAADGVAGVIIGRALYEGKVDLAAAIEMVTG